MADRAAVQALMGRVQEGLGPVDILLNNAGIGSSADPRPVLEYDDAFWDLTLAVNLTAPYLLCKAVLPGMVARRWGRIINVASINSRIPSPHAAAYVASKHGVLGLTRAIAVEMAPHNVRANCIIPGFIVTEALERIPAEQKGKIAARVPQRRMGTPMELAEVAAFLLSDAASHVTGQDWAVDGGVLESIEV